MAQLATFDTHKYIKELTATGFNEKQAEVIIKSILKGRDYDISNLATKEQLKNVQIILDNKIEDTKKELKKDISTLDNKIENTKKELKKDIENNKQELKKDIENNKQELKQEIELKTSQLETKIEKSKNTIVMWLISLVLAIGLMFIRIMFMKG